MGWKLSDFPDPRARVEQATAAPGEKRSVPCPHGELVNSVERVYVCTDCGARFTVTVIDG